MRKKHAVFISHHGKDDEHIQDFKAKVQERGCTIDNRSVDSTQQNNAEDEDYIKSMLRKRIEQCDTFICLIGYETYNREWVEWEIQQAVEMGKKIIGVFIYGAAEDAEIPDGIKEYADDVIGWQIDKIIDAIETDNYYSEKP